MTPKEKAQELVHKFLFNTPMHRQGDAPTHYKNDAKKCATIAVDEMIIQNGELYLSQLGEETIIAFYKKKNAYLFEVKEEIKKL